ncbi:MAG: hypothetical protein Q7T18_09445, partial [Sedimentisphaerales bacterium]|nr:hypothetical protein [Sedimentisphaerales bacterium]
MQPRPVVFPVITAMLVCTLYFYTQAYGIILHPDAGEPNLTTWTDRPVNAVVGRWQNNASFVVVAPKWILTVRHQGGAPATVVINDVNYVCIHNENLWTGGGEENNADIRLIRLKNSDGSDPDLAYAPPYTDTNDVDKDFVIGGYGTYRGATLSSGGYAYGYQWAESSNDTLRWGQNHIDGQESVQLSNSYLSYVLYAHFNLTGRPYEAAIAARDSGGGWFINQNGTWKLAALSAYVQRLNKTWYDDPNTLNTTDPDHFWGIRISSYATWINTIIAADCNGPVQADLNNDCKVDFSDFALFAKQWLRTGCIIANNYCGGTDFTPTDGKVDFSDLLIFTQSWLVDTSPP